MENPRRPARATPGRRAILFAALALAGGAAATGRRARAEAAPLRIGYLRSSARRLTISLRDAPARDNGLAGAQLALEDSNTTGAFTGQSFELLDRPVAPEDDAAAAWASLAAEGVRLALTDLPAPGVLALAGAAAAQGGAVFNIAAPDDDLRGAACRPNLFHVAPSRAMLADALAQYLAWKRWTRWLLIVGSHPEDAALAAAYRRAAKRFGAKIVEERASPDTGGARQTDSGVTQTQQQMPVLTQNAPAYDVAVAADENEVFAGYLPYRTWDARPVAGSAGLVPTTWDASADSWGGAQLQSRFQRRFRRAMTPLDMQAWTALRLIGEAASRAGAAADPAAILAALRDPDFALAAYKGVRLSLRPWDNQLRQPILLVDGRTVVSVSPQPGFLHQVTELDTLGVDRPESACAAAR